MMAWPHCHASSQAEETEGDIPPVVPFWGACTIFVFEPISCGDSSAVCWNSLLLVFLHIRYAVVDAWRS